MAAEVFKVNTVRLNNDAGNTHASAARISQQLTALQTAVGEMDEMWDGPAKQEFHQVFMDDLSALSVMVTNLNKLYQYQSNAKQKYETCENKAISKINQA